MNANMFQSLQILRQALPEAARILDLDMGDALHHWTQTVDQKLLPRLDKACPLTVAICGGGSAGKSTLFNTLVGQPLSPVGGQAGLNRRVLMATRETPLESDGYFKHLDAVFDHRPQPLKDPDQLLQPGDPLYCVSNHLPSKVILLDTPDIDTGARSIYTNRDVARQALQAADLFIYVFTNATYNNRDNTDFIAEMLTGMGTRPCFLVYRVYPSFSDAQVRAHARTVAGNIYGRDGNRQVMGLYRADEDNAVAAGQQPLTMKPVGDGHPDLLTHLASLDIQALRAELLSSMATDVFRQAGRTHQVLRSALNDLTRYTEALMAAQSHAVQRVLSHFPTDRVLRRFSRIWMQTDPRHIKWMRTSGRLISWPIKTAARTIRRMAQLNESTPATPTGNGLVRQVESDLLGAANQLYQQCMAGQLATREGTPVPVPPALESIRQQLSRKSWPMALENLLSHQQQVLSWSQSLDADLRDLAVDLRARMGWFDQVRQTFAALLNVIPATAAITYILHTGDPVGAAGIKVKLTGFLGLHDLYALVAVPATAGISSADRHQLEMLLQPLARTWLANKYKVVQQLFERYITGEVLQAARTNQERSATRVEAIESALGGVQGASANGSE